MSSAARKYYHDKAMVTLIDRQPGEMTVYSPRTVVAELDTESEEPPPQVLLDEAQTLVAQKGTKGEVRVLRPRRRGRAADRSPRRGARRRGPHLPRDRRPRPHRRADRQAGALPEGPRGRARQRLQRVLPEGRRADERHRQALRARRHDRRPRQAPRRSSRATSSPAPSATARASASARSSSTSTSNPKGPQLVLSRTDPRLLIRLFEMEVPEIYDGTVVIKGAVRQPGERAKVAVRSRERDVDPVGACVGMRGSRVQSIMRELHGEKIDVILYSDDLITFAQNALAPAKITRVSPIHHEDGGDEPRLRRRGRPALARDRQEGPERPARLRAHRHEDRDQGRDRGQGRGRPGALAHAPGLAPPADAGRRDRGHRREDRRSAWPRPAITTLGDLLEKSRRGARGDARDRREVRREDPRGGARRSRRPRRADEAEDEKPRRGNPEPRPPKRRA